MALQDSLPTAGMSFEQLITNKKLYIDKTDMVAALARREGPFFLSRPRRFGKSTLLSTFKELFEHGKDKFADLKLEKDEPWVDDKTYKVLHLDFSQARGTGSDLNFKKIFIALIENRFKSVNMALGHGNVWELNIEDALDQCEDRSLVLLIDEYDAPLISVLDDPVELKNRLAMIDGFLCAVKRQMGKFRFVFITGVAKIANLGIGSGFNNIRDISFSDRYGAIVGITQEELEKKFKPYIANAAKILRKKEPGLGWNIKKVVQELKLNYDGYSFNGQARCKVYNPWSVLNFFEEPQQGFMPYWLESGSNTGMLTAYIRKMVKLGRGLGELPDFFNEDYKVVCSKSELFPSIDDIFDDDFPLLPILYQTGYLTVKSSAGEDFEVGFPNSEVKRSFAQNVIQKLTGKPPRYERDTYLPGVRDALEKRDLPKLKELFNQYLNNFSYASLAKFDECLLRDTLFSSLRRFNGTVSRESLTGQGRVDLIIENDRYMYIIELKVRKDRNEIDEAVQTARRQIINRRYALRLTCKQVISVILVFINEQKFDDRRVPDRVRQIVYLEETDINEVLQD